MKRETILGSLVATFAVCIGLGFAGLNVSNVRADSEKITMAYGASVRYASESETNGLRFTAVVPQNLLRMVRHTACLSRPKITLRKIRSITKTCLAKTPYTTGR